MASIFWSWIFTVSLIQTGFSQPINANCDVLTKRALAPAFLCINLFPSSYSLNIYVTFYRPEFDNDKHTRTIFIAVVVVLGVIVGAVIITIVLTVMRTKVVDPELCTIKSAEKPTIQKVQWWHSSKLQSSPPEDRKHPEGSRTERIKAALGMKKERTILPLHDRNDKSASEIIIPPPIQRPQNPDVHNWQRNLQPLRKPSTQVPTPPHAYGLPSQPRLPPMAVVAPDPSPMKGDKPRSFPKPPESSETPRFGSRHPFVNAKASNAHAINRPLESYEPRSPPLSLEEVPRRQIRNDARNVRVVASPF